MLNYIKLSKEKKIMLNLYCAYKTHERPRSAVKKYLLLTLILLCVRIINCERIEKFNDTEVMRRTLPAYALVLTASRINQELKQPSKCQSELNTFRFGIDNKTLWAIRMLDSSGEPKPGFVYGNNYWLGSRSQCLDTTNRSPLVLKPSFMIKNALLRNPSQEFPPYDLNYFVAHFRHNSTIQYHVRLANEDLVTLGLCLPASCTTKELTEIFNLMFQEKSLMVNDVYSADFKLVQVRDLQDDKRWIFTPHIIFIKILLAIIWSFMIIGTVYEILLRRKRLDFEKDHKACENNNERIKLNENLEASTVERNSNLKPRIFGKLLLCFSVISNTKLIFSVKLSSESVAQIHGIRFLGMIWIVLIHTIYYMGDYADNKTWSWRLGEGFTTQIISNSTLSVDTFFFLSGFLVSHMYLSFHRNHPNNNQAFIKRNIGEFFFTIVRRFIRLTPPYVMMIGIVILSSNWFGNTSQFYMTERPHDVCVKYWWRNILYINNFFGRESMCMSWSWYLSNDMQFFIIATFLLILSSIYFYAAAFLIVFLLFGSIVITGYIAYINDYVATLDEQYNMLDLMYDVPWTRIGPYLIGMITAYLVTRLNGKLSFKKKTIVMSWILACSCNFCILFGLYYRQISVLTTAFYVSLSRTLWAIGLAWMLVACCTNHGGIVNTILCLKAWIPLSRLTYCAYLLNPFLINSIYLHSETAVHVDFWPNVTIFLGILLMTYISAYVFSLMVETPTILLMRIFINVKKR